MAARKAKAQAGRAPDEYLSLIRQFPLRPIRTEGELDQAIAMINSLVERDDLAAAEQDYLDVLGDLVERYEAQAHPIADVPASAVLQELLDARRETLAALARTTNIALGTLSELATGKRVPTRAQMLKLARYFHVDPQVFSEERP